MSADVYNSGYIRKYLHMYTTKATRVRAFTCVKTEYRCVFVHCEPLLSSNNLAMYNHQCERATDPPVSIDSIFRHNVDHAEDACRPKRTGACYIVDHLPVLLGQREMLTGCGGTRQHVDCGAPSDCPHCGRQLLQWPRW